MIPLPRRIRAKDGDLQTVQENLIDTIETILRQQVLDGVYLTGVTLNSGTTQVQHKLSRVPVGYIITGKNGFADIYDTARDSNFLTIQSTAAVTVSMWVF